MLYLNQARALLGLTQTFRPSYSFSRTYTSKPDQIDESKKSKHLSEANPDEEGKPYDKRKIIKDVLSCLVLITPVAFIMLAPSRKNNKHQHQDPLEIELASLSINKLSQIANNTAEDIYKRFRAIEILTDKEEAYQAHEVLLSISRSTYVDHLSSGSYYQKKADYLLSQLNQKQTIHFTNLNLFETINFEINSLLQEIKELLEDEDLSSIEELLTDALDYYDLNYIQKQTIIDILLELKLRKPALKAMFELSRDSSVPPSHRFKLINQLSQSGKRK